MKQIETKNYDTIIYYDESEHSRKINGNTLRCQNYCDNFIGSYTKVNNSQLNDFEKAYSAFEEKHKQRMGGNELKSSSIKNKQIKHGFASMNEHNLNFISDYLDLLENTEVLITMTSKVEFLANQILSNYQNDFIGGIIIIDADAMKYTLAKSINQYKPDNVIKAIENKDNNLVKELICFYEDRIEKNKKNIALKAKENNAFKELLMLLSSIVNTDVKLQWEYEPTFECVNELMMDNQNKTLLIMDKEGNGRSANAALNAGIKNAIEDDSTNQYGLRCSDMVAGIINKLSKSMQNNMHDKTYDEEMEKKILSKEYFKMNYEQFQLYKKLSKLMSNRKINICSTSRLKDSSLRIEAFMDYISSYEDFDEFQKINELDHTTLFNDELMIRINTYLNRMHNKLDMTEIDTSNEYFIGKAGQKIYNDITKHQYLDLSQDVDTYHVLNVGMMSKKGPTITIEINGQAELFRLPDTMLDWVEQCIAYSMLGHKIFPKYMSINDFNNLDDRINH